MGTAHQGANPERVQVDLARLILRSGKSIAVSAMALDSDGASGLQAAVFSSKVWAETGALAGSFISGLASASQTQTTNALGFATTQTTGRNALLQGVAQTAADSSKRLIDEATKEKPVLVVDPGVAVTIFFNDEVRL